MPHSLTRTLCWLYGHQWRHPGAPEIVIGNDRPPRISYPVVCSTCNGERDLTPEPSAWHPSPADRSATDEPS